MMGVKSALYALSTTNVSIILPKIPNLLTVIGQKSPILLGIEKHDPSDYVSLDSGSDLTITIGKLHDDQSLWCDFGSSPLNSSICDSIRQEIEPSLRGDFLPTELTMIFGNSGFELDLPFLPNFTLKFWGYSSPDDTLEFFKRVTTIPPLREVGEFLADIGIQFSWYFYVDA